MNDNRRGDDRLPPSFQDFVIGVVVVLLIGLLFAVFAAWLSPAKAQNFPRTPVTVIRVEQPFYVYLPNGTVLLLPAGTELDACRDKNNLPMIYDPFSLTHRIPVPCVERPVFRDGFED